MDEVSQRGHTVAGMLRVATLIVFPPLLVAANAAVCSNTLFAVFLVYAPVVGGWLGLMSRPILDAAMDRDQTRVGFSGKGAIVGAVVAFLLVLVFTPKTVDRSTLVALFIASGLFYYTVGKLGCFFIGCCRAVESRTVQVPLPLIETTAALTLCIFSFVAATVPHSVRMDMFPLIVAGLLIQRIYSRVARGARLVRSLLQLDSLMLAILFLFAIAGMFIGASR